MTLPLFFSINSSRSLLRNSHRTMFLQIKFLQRIPFDYSGGRTSLSLIPWSGVGGGGSVGRITCGSRDVAFMG